jgi:hypothetical protein
MLRIGSKLGSKRRAPEPPDLQDKLRYLAAHPTPLPKEDEAVDD